VRLVLPVVVVEPLPNGTEAMSGEEVVFSMREVRSFSSLLVFALLSCLFLRVTNSLVRPICRLDCFGCCCCCCCDGCREDNFVRWWC